MKVGDELYYLEHLSFYKVKVVAINKDKNQVLVEEDGSWLVVNCIELFTDEDVLKMRKE